MSRCDALVYPGLHLFRQPRDPAGAEPYPLGELAGGFEPRDVREASTARQRSISVPSWSPVSVSSDTPSKGSIAMLARNQLAGRSKRELNGARSQCAHSTT